MSEEGNNYHIDEERFKVKKKPEDEEGDEDEFVPTPYRSVAVEPVSVHNNFESAYSAEYEVDDAEWVAGLLGGGTSLMNHTGVFMDNDTIIRRSQLLLFTLFRTISKGGRLDLFFQAVCTDDSIPAMICRSVMYFTGSGVERNIDMAKDIARDIGLESELRSSILAFNGFADMPEDLLRDLGRDVRGFMEVGGWSDDVDKYRVFLSKNDELNENRFNIVAGIACNSRPEIRSSLMQMILDDPRFNSPEHHLAMMIRLRSKGLDRDFCYQDLLRRVSTDDKVLMDIYYSLKMRPVSAEESIDEMLKSASDINCTRLGLLFQMVGLLLHSDNCSTLSEENPFEPLMLLDADYSRSNLISII